MNHIKSTLLLSLLTVLIILMGNAIGVKAGILFAFLMVIAMKLLLLTVSETSTASAAKTPVPFKYQREN